MNDAPLLLFVCSGNICRSPMAAVIAADAAERAGMKIRVASAGTMALLGNPAEADACQAVAELGLSLRGHRAMQAEGALVRDAALIVAATRSHRAWLIDHEPHAASKVMTFDELTGLGDIPDPYGAGVDDYRTVRDTLVAGMPRVLDVLKATAAAKAKHRSAQ